MELCSVWEARALSFDDVSVRWWHTRALHVLPIENTRAWHVLP